jgi:hypothetical protein
MIKAGGHARTHGDKKLDTSMVCAWCMKRMAFCACALDEYVMNAQPATPDTLSTPTHSSKPRTHNVCGAPFLGQLATFRVHVYNDQTVCVSQKKFQS